MAADRQALGQHQDPYLAAVILGDTHDTVIPDPLHLADNVSALLDLLSTLQARIDTYNRLGLADDGVLSPDAFEGTGATVASYRAAVLSAQALLALMPSGHGTNLEQFSR